MSDFDDFNSTLDPNTTHEELTQQAYQRIRELQVQIDLVKKDLQDGPGVQDGPDVHSTHRGGAG